MPIAAWLRINVVKTPRASQRSTKSLEALAPKPPKSAPMYKKPHIFREGSIFKFSRMWDHQDLLSPVQMPPYRCIPI